MAFFTDVHATQKYRLGTRVKDSANNEYIYLTGVASTVDGSWVTYDELHLTTLVDSDVAASIKGPVAIANAVVDATTEFGWYTIWGVDDTAKAISGGAAADNGLVFATSTAGQVDDVAVADTQIVGAIFREAEGATTAGDAKVQVSYPWIGVDEAA